MARIVESTRGGQIMEHEGYRYYSSKAFTPRSFYNYFFINLCRYTRRSTNRAKTRVYWRCVENGIFFLRGKAHSHVPDQIEIGVQEVVRSLKRKASEHPNAPPASLYRDEVAAVNDNVVIMNLPQRTEMLRTINRQQNRHRPTNPMTLAEVNVVAPYTHTINGELFLQFDSTETDVHETDRFIIFYTISRLRRLCASRLILCDGTFKTVPNLF